MPLPTATPTDRDQLIRDAQNHLEACGRHNLAEAVEDLHSRYAEADNLVTELEDQVERDAASVATAKAFANQLRQQLDQREAENRNLTARVKDLETERNHNSIIRRDLYAKNEQLRVDLRDLHIELNQARAEDEYADLPSTGRAIATGHITTTEETR